MDTEFVIPLLWFFAGAMSYRFAATMINYSHAGAFIQELNKYALLLIGLLSEDIHFIRQRKYLMLEDTDTSRSEVNFIREMDDKVFDAWKLSVISRFFSVYPKHLHKLVPFQTWDGAMKELTRIYKEDDAKNPD